MYNKSTKRIIAEGSLAGVDDILYKRDRQFTLLAHTECFTMRLDREVFEKMMREDPEIRTSLLEEANIRG